MLQAETAFQINLQFLNRKVKVRARDVDGLIRIRHLVFGDSQQCYNVPFRVFRDGNDMICLTSNQLHEFQVEELVVQRRVGQLQRHEVVQSVDVLGTLHSHGHWISPVHDLNGRTRIYAQPAMKIEKIPDLLSRKNSARSTVCQS